MFDFLRSKKSLNIPQYSDAKACEELKSWKNRNVFVLFLLENGEFQGNKQNPSAEEFIAWTRANAEKVAAEQAAQPYTFQTNGRKFFPVFSSVEMAQEFVKADPENVWKGFGMNEMVGSDLIRYLADNCFSGTVVVLNSRTSSEQRFTHEQIRAVCSK